MTQRNRLVGLAVGSVAMVCCSIAMSRAFDDGQMKAGGGGAGVVAAAGGASGEGIGADEGVEREDRQAWGGGTCNWSVTGSLVYTLDVGAANDNDSNCDMYIWGGSGLRDPNSGDGRTWRELDPNGWLYFHLKDDPNDLDNSSAKDVPNYHARITLEYYDGVDERACSSWDSTYTQCRPQLWTRLDFHLDGEEQRWFRLGPFAGWNSGDWEVRPYFIEACPWQTLRSFDVEGVQCFEFAIEFPGRYTGEGSLLIDKITVEFFKSNPGDFYSERRDIRDADDPNVGPGFEERAPAADPPLDPNDLSDANEPCVLYARNYIEKIYPQTVPGVGEFVEDNLEVTAFEVAGEREPVTFALYALTDLTNVTVTVDELEGTSSNYTIPDDNIEVSAVMFMEKRWAYFADKYYAEQPWYLDDVGEGMSIPALSNQQFWLTVNVPEGTPADVYTGDVTIAGRHGGGASFSKTVQVSLRVYDVELAEDGDAGAWMLCGDPMSQYYHPADDPNVALDDIIKHDIELKFNIETHITLTDPNFPVDMGDLEDDLYELNWRGMLSGEPRVTIIDNAQALWGQLQVASDPNCQCATSHFVEDCPYFDEVYGGILAQYKAAFNVYGVTPAVTFRDEPGNSIWPRRASNYLNRLAQEQGMRTWVTYGRACAQPLGGYGLTFNDMSSADADPNNVPAFLAAIRSDPSSDLDCVGYWDFTGNDPNDASYYSAAHTETLKYGTQVSGGMLQCPGTWARMEVADDDTLDFTDAAAVYLWFQPFMTEETCHEWQCVYPIYKCGGSTADPSQWVTNYQLAYYGEGSGYPGLLNWFGYVNGAQEKLPEGPWTDCVGCDPSDPNTPCPWYNVLWQYDRDLGATMYVNGVPTSASPLHADLMTNLGALLLGYYVPGRMDNIVLFKRTLDPNEVDQVLSAIPGVTYNPDQQVCLNLDLSAADPRDVPSTITLSLYDSVRAFEAYETHKELVVYYLDDNQDPNERVAWSDNELDPYEVVTVDLSSYPTVTGLSFCVTNGQQRRESLQVYFMEDYWRNADWQTTTSEDPNESHWSVTPTPDPDGYLGPVYKWLDVRVYHPNAISEGEIEDAVALGDEVGFYTTYPCTQPMPLHNRFLHGLFASKVKDVYQSFCPGGDCEGRDAVGVYPWAYQAGGTQPWDEFDEYYLARATTTTGRRLAFHYQMVMPSWEDRVYDTLPYETLREGIEDSRVIATLKAAIDDALDVNPSDTCALAAGEYLGSLLESLSPNLGQDYYYRAEIDPIEDYADMTGRVLLDLAGDAEAYTFFDEMRQTMLDYIVILTDPSQDCNGNCILDAYDVEGETSLDCNADGIPDECQLCAGDLDCDGDVDYDDINLLVDAIGCVGGDPNCWTSPCPWLNGDCNGDCNVTYADVDTFLLLIGTTCP